MTLEDRKKKLSELISEYKSFKEAGKLDLTSEETIRTWLNQFLEIFGWDVRDTSQILQEKVLSKKEKEALKGIGSTSTRPDYTFKLAKEKLTFLDAKDITVSIVKDKEAAFQIKSYGWSILAPCAFISNFEEFAIYNCTYVPSSDQDPTFGRIYLTIDEYLDNFEILEKHLNRENVYGGQLHELYSDSLSGVRDITKETPDLRFAQQLSEFRLSLAQAILDNNSSSIGDNTENLSYLVQIIINRLLFIRVCEARRIEENDLLNSFRASGFWKNFKESSYLDFYEHYDGHLFDRINSIHNLTIPDITFDGILDYLYYPSPYRFEVIPTKLLSDIYEIFLSKKLLIENGLVKDELKSEYSKTKGAVSTPQFVVQEVIQKTIPQSLLESLSIEELFNLKILDPACGSGVFLIELFDYLESIIKSRYSQTRPEEFSTFFVEAQNENLTNLLCKKAIIDNCIFAVDIDLEAVEVAKMSLSLKAIDVPDYPEHYSEIGIFGSRILHGVGNNIKCGNSLVSDDIIEKFPSLADNEIELLKTNPFDWTSEHGFPFVFSEKSGFDFVIGNPPYVEVKNYNVDLPFMHQYIKEKFPSSRNGKIDLAVPFIEKGIELLNQNGRMGFVVQKRFFKTDYGKKIREIITDDNLVYSITDFESTEIFKDRITYVAILILDKSSPNFLFYKNFTSKIETLSAELRETPPPEINSESYTILPSNSLTSTPWVFDDPEILSIRTKLLEAGSIGEFLNIRVGIQVLWDRAYHIKPISIRDGVLTGKSHLEESFQVELEACRPLICNIKFSPYRSDDADYYVIFPYDVDEDGVHEILFPDFENRFPLAAAYLSQHRTTIESEVETLPRKFPNQYTNDHWHLFTRVQNHGATYPKVLIPMTALDTFGAVTFSNDAYCDNANVYFMQLPDITNVNLHAVSAIVNSTLFSVLARSIANPQSNGYFKFNKQFLDPIPFPIENFQNNQDGFVTRLSELAQEIAGQQQRLTLASPAQKRTLSIAIQRNWTRLDDIVYNLYGLINSEKEEFQRRGRNVDRVEILD
ncbi:Eco57I restriction-modification methylase domain-containing protein [Fulvivirga lutimaris]|uniref:Eco57I restriction-modification methylase domain-containing protein n=1 Tax=Fulvivirga lutimaris TaxID=1819566 RepID=UPI0012BD20BE|nr:N-6 DNA methylase [Fulvivirga lutimaris]MTI38378.1 restriction endonuclease subunit M [Fulvivirga lutimaris]